MLKSTAMMFKIGVNNGMALLNRQYGLSGRQNWLACWSTLPAAFDWFTTYPNAIEAGRSEVPVKYHSNGDAVPALTQTNCNASRSQWGPIGRREHFDFGLRARYARRTTLQVDSTYGDKFVKPPQA